MNTEGTYRRQWHDTSNCVLQARPKILPFKVIMSYVNQIRYQRYIFASIHPMNCNYTCLKILPLHVRLLISGGIFQAKRKQLAMNRQCTYCVFTLFGRTAYLHSVLTDIKSFIFASVQKVCFDYIDLENIGVKASQLHAFCPQAIGIVTLNSN